ncbi:MAG: thioredoxin family protein [Flavobacteriaceae bacterium]|nr:thioredoxin family protein [Flavobacteriaceae bacterium]
MNSIVIAFTSLSMKVIEKALKSAMSYDAYFKQMSLFSEEERTSGSDQSDVLIDFTALNYKRMKRLDKSIVLNETHKRKIKKLDKKITWLVITEAWCGDAAQVIPVLNKIAEATDNIDLKLVYRDENEALMDAFLTNGARSIPKLIALNEKNEVLYTWGPRPSEATKMVVDFKSVNGNLTPEFKIDLQKWYNNDKGTGIIVDQITMLNKIE